MKKGSVLSYISAGLVLGLLSGCAGVQYFKGFTPGGEKVYIGPTDIRDTEAYRNYIYSSHSEAAKLNYLFERLKLGESLFFYRDGNKYNWLEAYRGGKWLVRNRYNDGDNAREFAKKHIWHSDQTGKPHLVQFPDSSIHEGYYILLNELELLESTAKEDGKS